MSESLTLTVTSNCCSAPACLWRPLCRVEMQSTSLARRVIASVITPITNVTLRAKNKYALNSTLRCLSTSIVNLGDKVPINYTKDGKDPVIKEDKDYPEWVFQLHSRLPSKNDLMNKLETEGIESLSIEESKRLKRLITLKTIKDSNLSTGKSSGV